MDIAPPRIAETAAAPPPNRRGRADQVIWRLHGGERSLLFGAAGRSHRPGRPQRAGKTTTLRCLAGIIPPTRGTVRIGGFDLATQPVEAKRRLASSPMNRGCSII